MRHIAFFLQGPISTSYATLVRSGVALPPLPLRRWTPGAGRRGSRVAPARRSRRAPSDTGAHAAAQTVMLGQGTAHGGSSPRIVRTTFLLRASRASITRRPVPSSSSARCSCRETDVVPAENHIRRTSEWRGRRAAQACTEVAPCGHPTYVCPRHDQSQTSPQRSSYQGAHRRGGSGRLRGRLRPD